LFAQRLQGTVGLPRHRFDGGVVQRADGGLFVDRRDPEVLVDGDAGDKGVLPYGIRTEARGVADQPRYLPAGVHDGVPGAAFKPGQPPIPVAADVLQGSREGEGVLTTIEEGHFIVVREGDLNNMAP